MVYLSSLHNKLGMDKVIKVAFLSFNRPLEKYKHMSPYGRTVRVERLCGSFDLRNVSDMLAQEKQLRCKIYVIFVGAFTQAKFSSK